MVPGLPLGHLVNICEIQSLIRGYLWQISVFAVESLKYCERTYRSRQRWILYKEFAMDLLLAIISRLLIGAAAGWLASRLVKGSGYGIIGNTIVGMTGGFIGGWLLSLVNVGMSGLITIIGSVMGAVILLFIIGLFKAWFDKSPSDTTE